MRHDPTQPTPAGMRDPVARMLSTGAVLLGIASLVFSMAGGAPAKDSAGALERSATGALSARLNKLNARVTKLVVNCPIPNAVDLGTWCLESAPFPLQPKEKGKANYLFAAQKCVSAGGWLPTAAQLIGAAKRVKLQSTIDDNPTTSGADEFPDPKFGIRDRREMSSDLFTVSAGSSAAGSEGVTSGSRGNASLGEPDPVPYPADPLPNTLNYVTVYDNHNIGGFAGGVPVGTPENFRCAYAKGSQGQNFDN